MGITDILFSRMNSEYDIGLEFRMDKFKKINEAQKLIDNTKILVSYNELET